MVLVQQRLRWLMLAALGLSSAVNGEPDARPAGEACISCGLDEARALYERAAASRWIVATDANERLVGSRPLLRKLIEEQRFDDLFLLGDEAFEQMASVHLGAGSGPAEPGERPARGQRVHDGERGGFDATSCRSCHFSGGPDGSASASQVTLFRGDGLHFDSSDPRDAPHVMGLGYIQILAREIERALSERVASARATASARGLDVEVRLVALGTDYGSIRVDPDGAVDVSAITGISSDLKVRPFGHKGQYRDLVALTDDALQQHFGIQSERRLARYGLQAATHLGDGPHWDPDADGRSQEVPAEHAVLIASYLAMLPTPVIRVPEDPRLQQAWAAGQGLFDSVGCASCHRPVSWLQDLELVIDGPPDVSLDLADAGQEPKPVRTDYSPDADGRIPQGIPIYAFTDLKRHDLGPELASAQDQVLADGSGVVAASEWLTRPLWGLADTAPYMHDGRAATLDEAIRLHGGDAAGAASAFGALSERDQRALLVFLNSLTRDGTVLVE
jgi:cytochrome c peroxidase